MHEKQWQDTIEKSHEITGIIMLFIGFEIHAADK
jgi:hypothetical protein